MQIPQQLINCLNESGVAYDILQHPEAVTAQRVAQVEHVRARHQAKVVMVKSDGRHLMTVIPADRHIDLLKVEQLTGKPASHRNAGVLCARMSFRPDSKCPSTSEHNGVMKRPLPAGKAPAGRYALVAPM